MAIKSSCYGKGWMFYIRISGEIFENLYNRIVFTALSRYSEYDFKNLIMTMWPMTSPPSKLWYYPTPADLNLKNLLPTLYVDDSTKVSDFLANWFFKRMFKRYMYVNIRPSHCPWDHDLNKLNWFYIALVCFPKNCTFPGYAYVVF